MNTSIECSGFKDNQFVFLTSSASAQQTLNFVSNDQTLFNFNMTLESIAGYPKQHNFSKCAYSESTGSMYTTFTNSSSQNISLYELKIEEKNASFTNLNFIVDSITISSFVFTQGLNNTPYLSYISNGTLIFKSFDQKNITKVKLQQQDYGFLLPGRNDTRVFLINESGFTQYDIANKTVQKITAPIGISPESDTKGQVISVGLEDYFIFKQKDKVYMARFNDSQSNYTAISSENLNVITTTIPTTVTSSPISISAAAKAKATENSTSSKTDVVALPLMATPFMNQNSDPNKLLVVETATAKPTHFIVKRQVVIDENAAPPTDYNMTFPDMIDVYAVMNTSERFPLDLKILSLGGGGSQYLIDTRNGDQIYQSTLNETAIEEANEKLNGGGIAGVVVGVVLFVLLVGAGLFFLMRKKKRGSRLARQMVDSREIDSEKCSLKDFKEFSHTTSCSYDPKNMIYIDGRPDISPLRYVQNVIDFADLSGEELQKVEPEAREKLVLFGGHYISPESEVLKEYGEGYAMRHFSTSYGQLITVHYFNESLLKPFIRSAHALSSFTLPSPHMVKHMRAIVLSHPTPKNKYQYIWITSPVKLEFSLYNILFSKNMASIQIDKTDMNFQIWSIYAMMKSVEALHSHDFVHVNITLDSFFFEDASEVTDWKMCGFDYTHKENTALEAYNLNLFSSPELILETNGNIAKKELDIWSLGCTIYTLVTGKLLFETTDQVKDLFSTQDETNAYLEDALKSIGLVNRTFEQVTRLMLQVLPEDRKSVTEIIQVWDQVYNMS